MSVEVKTPTRTQFEHMEFQCGELQPCTFHTEAPVGGDDSKNDKPNQKVESGPKPTKQVTILADQQKPDGPRWNQQQTKRRRFSTPPQRGQPHDFRKRRHSSRPEKIVLPTKFLLGGNISDPLNLNSLYDDETGQLLNKTTPNCSPLPFPAHRGNVELVIPPNITDPLNLNAGEGSEDLNVARLMARKRRRHKHKKKSEEDIPTSAVTSITIKETEKKKNLTEALKIDIDAAESAAGIASADDLAKSDSELLFSTQKKCEDRIVSPVIPQSSKGRKRRRTVSECMKPDFSEAISNARRALLGTESVPYDPEMPNCGSAPQSKKTKRQSSGGSVKSTQHSKPTQQAAVPKKGSGSAQKFVYGNYNRYYGYRNPDVEEDRRLKCLQPEWFEGKDVLDIGCNVGHITLAIARNFRPRKVIGMDIDGKLISAARKNIRHYMTSIKTDSNKFPMSLTVNYGPIVAPSFAQSTCPVFPNNIMFLQGNYVLEYDELLEVQKEEYDMVVALSITKWIHMNWGDDGMKRFFKRIFKQLRPGGRLLLEPQGWPSYKKKKKLTEEIFKNYQAIRFKPDQFTDFLLSREIGFSTCEAIEVPFNKSAGFRRPLQLFTKPDTLVNSPNPVTPTTATDIEPSEVTPK